MKSGFRQKLFAGPAVLVSLCILAGCTQVRELRERVLPSEEEKSEASKPRKGTAYYIHKVKWNGESLSIIAKWYTGSLENWKVLAKINPGIDPSLIHIGQEVRIPEDLLNTRKSMPESFVASFGPKKAKEAPPKPTEPEPAKPKEMTVAPRKEVKVEPPAEPAYYVHKVKWAGESLSIIAAWYTGSLQNWKALAKVNPKVNPSRIYIGQKIRIPGELLKTREPMPQSFPADFGKKKGESAPPKSETPQPSDEEEPELFGPKPFPKN